MNDFETYVSYKLNLDVDSKIVNTKVYQTLNSGYIILNYNKDILCFDDANHSYYRSTIFSFPDKKLLCFSPPKSVKNDVFIQKNPGLTEDHILINEMIEGVMMNLFYDSRVKSWQVSTKNAIGGNYGYKPKGIPLDTSSYIDMFFDALRCTSNIKPNCERLNRNSVIELFPKQYSYTFVLQHPENRIVLPIEEAKLYLVAVYEISENRAIEIPTPVYEEWQFLLNIQGIIHFPRRFNETDYDELIQKYSLNHSDYFNPGIMLKNMKTGERTKMMNKSYMHRLKYKQVNPSFHYHYLCFQRIGKTDDFLAHYPMYKNHFKHFKYEYLEFLNSVHKAYIQKYVEKSPSPISPKYLVHIDRIHKEVYIPSIASKQPKKIDKECVRHYFEKMEPGSLLFYLNYNNRKYMKTTSDL